jgi:hypothetical protein
MSQDLLALVLIGLTLLAGYTIPGIITVVKRRNEAVKEIRAKIAQDQRRQFGRTFKP